MPHDASFADLMARLRAGDDGAATAVFQRFANRLIGLTRLHLDRRVRAKVDPEDVLQSVYKSFFLRHARGQFDLDGWDGLWALLTVLTVRKCGRVNRHFHAARRDVAAEVAEAPEEGETPWQVLSRNPTPDHVAMLAELVERLLGGLGNRDREVVALALQGYTPAEIVTQTAASSSVVYRTLARVRDWLRQESS
jgi:RNA polymerase sigma-70 factor (ECF subfamily)